MIRQAFGEESMSCTRRVQTHLDQKKARQVKSKVKSMLITFLWHQGDCSQRIHAGRPYSQFHILLWHFTVIASKCAKTSPWTLVTKELAVASRQSTFLHFLFHQHDYHTPPTLLAWLGSMRLPCFPNWKTATFYATEAESPVVLDTHRKQLLRCI
jgi:hypothetical protein